MSTSNSVSNQQNKFVAKLAAYGALTRVDKPVGALLLLWPTLWALWFAAEGLPDMHLLLVFVAGVFVMRAAGCAINDFADRDFDKHVKRTKHRPLASGRLAPSEALLVFFLLGLAALGLALQLNSLALWLSIPGMILAATYPFMKRVTHLPQVYLGLAFSWGIPMAYAAQANQVAATAWLLFCANILWTIAYDTIYAMVDRDDDSRIGIKSTAVLLGTNDRSVIAILQMLFVLLMVAIGLLERLSAPYFLGIVAAAALLAYQHTLIAKRERDKCFRAFLHNNWVGLAIFAGLALNFV